MVTNTAHFGRDVSLMLQLPEDDLFERMLVSLVVHNKA